MCIQTLELADFGVDGTSKKRRGKMATTPKDEFDGSNASTKMRGDEKPGGKASITPGKLVNSPQWNGQNYSTISDCVRGQGGRGGISKGEEGHAVMKRGGSVCPTTTVHGSVARPRRLDFDNIREECSINDAWVRGLYEDKQGSPTEFVWVQQESWHL